MQIPAPISRRRSTSAVKHRTATAIGHDTFRTSVILLLGITAVLPWKDSIAEIPAPPPDLFKVTLHRSGSTWTAVWLEDGHIGEVDLDEIRTGNPERVTDLLLRHREWTGADEHTDVEIIAVRDGIAIFAQIVDGVRVNGDSSVRFVGDGYVTQLKSMIVSPDGIREEPTIGEGEAIEIGREAARNRFVRYYGGDFVRDRIELAPPDRRPVLYLDPQHPDEPVRYVWRMIMSPVGGGPECLVVVDAHSGDAVIR